MSPERVDEWPNSLMINIWTIRSRKEVAILTKLNPSYHISKCINNQFSVCFTSSGHFCCPRNQTQISLAATSEHVRQSWLFLRTYCYAVVSPLKCPCLRVTYSWPLSEQHLSTQLRYCTPKAWTDSQLEQLRKRLGSRNKSLAIPQSNGITETDECKDSGVQRFRMLRAYEQVRLSNVLESYLLLIPVASSGSQGICQTLLHFSFFILQTVSRTPWTGSVRRKAATYTGQHKRE
jgi:hypothetical protein